MNSVNPACCHCDHDSCNLRLLEDNFTYLFYKSLHAKLWIFQTLVILWFNYLNILIIIATKPASGATSILLSLTLKCYYGSIVTSGFTLMFTFHHFSPFLIFISESIEEKENNEESSEVEEKNLEKNFWVALKRS